MQIKDQIIKNDELILLTGASGFIGTRVLDTLLEEGFTNLRCLVLKPGDAAVVREAAARYKDAHVDVMEGNLLKRKDCAKAVSGARIVFHLAAGFGKSYRHIYRNTVLATRNLIEATAGGKSVKRFLCVSSFTVYSTRDLKKRDTLDESCPVYSNPVVKGEAYCCGKIKQEEMLQDAGRRLGLPYTVVRPGYVYGPGNPEISGRIGVSKLGVFFHLGGSNLIPVSYVENCADAVVMAGLTGGVDGQVYNVLDDDLPRSIEFLTAYQEHVRPVRTLSLPKAASYMLCAFWGLASRVSGGRLPPTYNLHRWSDDWKGNGYSNRKLKEQLGWEQRVPFEEGARLYFEYCRKAG